MDFLNNASGQLGELFRSMTAGARITAAVLATVVVISLAYLVNQQVSRGGEYLLDGHRFSSSELMAAEGAFGSAELNGHEVEGGRISVPRAQRAQYMAALADAGAMPAHFSSYLTEALAKPGFFTSSRQTEAMWKVAVQRELASIIGKMSGIEWAAVFFHTEKKSGLHRETVKTAAVSVTPVGNRPLDPKRVPAIREFVAAAIGMPPQGVVVIDTSQDGRSYRVDGDDGMVSALNDPYLNHKKEYQKEFEAMVANALGFVQGVIVTASVELDREISTQMARLTPKRVTIAVAVPASHYEKIWREQNPAPPGQPAAAPDKNALDQIELSETAKIQNLVSGLVPPQLDAAGDPRPQVSIATFYPFSAPEAPQPTLAETALQWASMHYGALGMGLLVLLSLIMLRSMVRCIPRPPEAAGVVVPGRPPAEETAPSAGPEKAKPHFKGAQAAGSLRDELVEMVREDPDAAAGILRTWIGNAG